MLLLNFKVWNGRTDGWSDVWTVRRLVKIMRLMVPTQQLKLSLDELSWQNGAECGKKILKNLSERHILRLYFCIG